MLLRVASSIDSGTTIDASSGSGKSDDSVLAGALGECEQQFGLSGLQFGVEPLAARIAEVGGGLLELGHLGLAVGVDRGDAPLFEEAVCVVDALVHGAVVEMK